MLRYSRSALGSSNENHSATDICYPASVLESHSYILLACEIQQQANKKLTCLEAVEKSTRVASNRKEGKQSQEELAQKQYVAGCSGSRQK